MSNALIAICSIALVLIVGEAIGTVALDNFREQMPFFDL